MTAYKLQIILGMSLLSVYAAALHFGQLGSDNLANWLVRFYFGF